MRLLIALFLLLSAGAASAQTCKYVDSEGRVTYSNVPIKNAKKVSCFEPVKPPPQSAAPQPQPEAAARPRVDSSTQRQRDADRRSILEAELQSEENQLADAKRQLAEQEAVRTGDERNYERVLERLKPYQEAVAQHEKNVAALRQELANLR
jgi:hypothetical protein